ncbi:MAG: hypothetical protein MI919_01630, partial [Holophagales bacterium]|nr:hypothetical protein [Holophagales bacterium]
MSPDSAAPSIAVDRPARGVVRLSGESRNGQGRRRWSSHLLELGGRWVWIDPGPAEAREPLLATAGEILGSWDHLGLVVVTCLENEALGNLPEVLSAGQRALALMTLECWSFVELMEVPVDRVLLAGRYRDGLRLGASGARLDIVLHPYIQFTGAFLVREPESGSLFTGGLLASSGLGPWTSDGDWPAIEEYARRHMPCRSALRWSVDRIRTLPGT